MRVFLLSQASSLLKLLHSNETIRINRNDCLSVGGSYVMDKISATEAHAVEKLIVSDKNFTLIVD